MTRCSAHAKRSDDPDDMPLICDLTPGHDGWHFDRVEGAAFQSRGES